MNNRYRIVKLLGQVGLGLTLAVMAIGMIILEAKNLIAIQTTETAIAETFMPAKDEVLMLPVNSPDSLAIYFTDERGVQMRSIPEGSFQMGG